MTIPKVFVLLSSLLILASCWKIYNGSDSEYSNQKVWGYKPIYASEDSAKKIFYDPVPRSVKNPGNIYAFQNYIFQLDLGLGIHVIDNTTPTNAKRIGFIRTLGCSEISIKGNKIYTNSYDDLVILDFSNINNIHEYSRLKGVFAEYRYDSPIAQPPSTGYYECPDYGSFVVGWEKDSVIQSCYKN